MNLPLPKLQEWDNFYSRPNNKDRMCVKLTNPKYMIDNAPALSHGFYYFGDEYSIIFDPIKVEDGYYMLMEGSHQNPKGERLPLLSTWSHLRYDLNCMAPQGKNKFDFIFWQNRWWDAQLIYDYEYKGRLDVCPYVPEYWCNYCTEHGNYIGAPNYTHIGKHACYTINLEPCTIFNDTEKSMLTNLVEAHKQENILEVIADWFEDRCDGFCTYLRLAATGRKAYGCQSLKHMCETISQIKNDRASKLLLLAEGIGNVQDDP